jgi:predicted nucleic acid-binding protein
MARKRYKRNHPDGPATLVAVLDADVLFPMVLRDTLLRAAAEGCFRLHWSKRILDEVTRNLIADAGLESDKTNVLRTIMEEAFPDAEVEGWEEHESRMRNDPKDRHVVAAAVAIDASVIVTSNVRDFRSLPRAIVAMNPDQFLLKLLSVRSVELLTALSRQAAGYRRPPTSVIGLVHQLARVAPRFAERAAILLGSSHAQSFQVDD